VRNDYEDYESAKEWHEGEFAKFSRYDAACFEAELTKAGIGIRSTLRVLEVGYGNGKFLGWCRSRDVRADGLEINETLVERARKSGFTAFGVLDDSRKADMAQYDLIVAFDVLEHIARDELVRFVRDLKACLNPGGRMIFRFPNGDSPFSLYLQNGDITHQTAIGKAMFQQIASLAQLRLVYFGRTRQPLKHAGIVHAITIMIGLPLRIVCSYIFAIACAGGMHVDLSANLIAVVEV
jgi:2-polyprenyl-3-methyl-5-hydroxy-6-metoxy-1,4-benzoquinol methylase